MPAPHVQVVLFGSRLPAALEPALRQLGASVSFEPVQHALRVGPHSTSDALVVVDDERCAPGDARLERLLGRIAEKPLGTLVLTCRGPFDRPSASERLPVSYTDRRLTTDELAGRLAALVALRKTIEAADRSNRS